MSQQGSFVVFCAEQYKMARDMTGRELAELFPIRDMGLSLFVL